MDVEKDWEARFRVSSNTNWWAIVILLALVAIITLPLFIPIYIFLLLGLLPALFVSLILRKMGRRPLNIIGIAAIVVGVWATLLLWWVMASGNAPCSPCL